MSEQSEVVDHMEHNPDDHACWDVDPDVLEFVNDVGQSIGSVMGALDQAGYSPVAVDSAEFSHGVQFAHALVDGLMVGFTRVLQDRDGTYWDVSGDMFRATRQFHAVIAVAETMMGEVAGQMIKQHLIERLKHEDLSEDEISALIETDTARTVLMRNEGGLQMGLLSEESLDAQMMHIAANHHDDGTPGVRFVDITTRLPMGHGLDEVCEDCEADCDECGSDDQP